MTKHIFLVFFHLQLSSIILGCIYNEEEGSQCDSKFCFSHFYELDVGSVERFDCDESPSLTHSECESIVSTNYNSSSNTIGKNALCIHNNNETHCCCLAKSSDFEICGENFRNNDELLQLLDHEKIFNLVFSIISLAVISLLMLSGYREACKIWHNDNVPIGQVRSKLSKVFYAIFAVLSIATIWLFVPFREICKDHPNGVFRTPRTFLYQVFETSILSSMYFCYSIVALGFELLLFRMMKSRNFVNKSGGSALSLFIVMLTIPATYEPIIRTFDVSPTRNEYCARQVLWRLIVGHIFYLCYIILVLYRVILIFQMKMPEADPVSETVKSEHVPSIIASQCGQTYIESEYQETLQVTPRPFHVSQNGTSVLKVKNNEKRNWIALRALLSTTGFYKLNPSKFLIPPEREISIDVEQVLKTEFPPSHHNILMEWFSLGHEPHSMNLNSIWSKPYLVPQNQWKFFVLPIYLEENSADHSLDSESRSEIEKQKVDECDLETVKSEK